MNLEEAFAAIAKPLGLAVPDLMKYAGEDRIGGFHKDDKEARWPMGSIWEVEGQFVHALVRALRPQHVLEIGTARGCSTTHILEALALNGEGQLTSTDPGASGDLVPFSLRGRWTMLGDKAQNLIGAGKVSDVDFVYEDGPHDFEQTAEILTAVRQYLKPRIILSHDGCHFVVGKDIQEAHRRVFGGVNTFLIPPSDCGFAWQVPVKNGRGK